VKNSDGTFHNVHGYADKETLFNVSHPAKAAPIERDATEGVLRLKCDVHPWMTAYVLVSPHPYFAVTREDGRYALQDLPAGEYELEVWHEKLGRKVVPVTIPSGANAHLDLAFDSTSRG
jgi:hypothetical protein